MDRFFQPILSARPCTQPCLPRQVRSRTLTTLLAAQGPVSAHSRGLVSPADPTRSSDSSSAKTGWPASSHPPEVLNPFASRRRGDTLSLCRDLLIAHCANEPDTTTHLRYPVCAGAPSPSNGLHPLDRQVGLRRISSHSASPNRGLENT